jgi:hypothetical protein
MQVKLGDVVYWITLCPLEVKSGTVSFVTERSALCRLEETGEIIHSTSKLMTKQEAKDKLLECMTRYVEKHEQGLRLISVYSGLILEAKALLKELD